MKQTDPAQIEKAWNSLREMRQIRGSDLPPFYFQLANDPQLLEAFNRELMIMILGWARGVETTITVHGSKALEEGASIEEVGEALRIALMICGISAVLPAAPLFDMLEPDRSGNFEESEGFKG